MLTYQDYLAAVQEGRQTGFLLQAISEHRESDLYKTAQLADLYDHQKNKTINDYVKLLYNLTGLPVVDFTASNAKIASNFFHRLNTQRNTYSLGNGVTFTQHVRKSMGKDGQEVDTDETKEKLGEQFDTDLKRIGYYALIHGVAFGFWNLDHLDIFPVTEFVPLLDEETGVLRAGIRFWQLDAKKPMTVVLYEEDGVTRYTTQGAGTELRLVAKKTKNAYITTSEKAPADAEPRIISTDNYGGRLPIVPLWGSELHQSTLVGMRQGIDSYDLIKSGFANNLEDCSEIYWLIENYGGMSQQDLQRARDQMKTLHILSADTTQGGKITPYTQQIPYEARKVALDGLRSGLYEDFGGLDVHTIAAGATNDHIDAAYQPVDEEADAYEYQILEFVQRILALQGIKDTPEFKRNRISNQKEQVEMVILEAPYLDDETILRKFPNISPDEVRGILARRDEQDASRLTDSTEIIEEEETEE